MDLKMVFFMTYVDKAFRDKIHKIDIFNKNKF